MQYKEKKSLYQKASSQTKILYRRLHTSQLWGFLLVFVSELLIISLTTSAIMANCNTYKQYNNSYKPAIFTIKSIEKNGIDTFLVLANSNKYINYTICKGVDQLEYSRCVNMYKPGDEFRTLYYNNEQILSKKEYDNKHEKMSVSVILSIMGLLVIIALVIGDFILMLAIPYLIINKQFRHIYYYANLIFEYDHDIIGNYGDQIVTTFDGGYQVIVGCIMFLLGLLITPIIIQYT